jgi:hypothetical protein
MRCERAACGLTPFPTLSTVAGIMRQGWIWSMLFVLVAGCQSANRSRSPGEDAMFGPAYMRIHPTFTHIIVANQDSDINGIDAVIEFQDQFGEPTRSAGTVLFELYAFRPSDPNPRGVRLAHWEAALDTKDEQLAHWNPAVRGYSFELQYDKINTDNSYVLTAQVNREGQEGPTTSTEPGAGDVGGGGRFFGQLVLETTHEGKHGGRPIPKAALESPGH